jgi:type III secretory pathway component EscU
LLYLAGNGFFINTAITMISVQASLWAYLLLALDKSVDPEVQKYLSAVQVLQLGTLSVVVYLFTLTLEMGLLSSLFTIIRQVLQGQWVTLLMLTPAASACWLVLRQQLACVTARVDHEQGGLS